MAETIKQIKAVKTYNGSHGFIQIPLVIAVVAMITILVGGVVYYKSTDPETLTANVSRQIASSEPTVTESSKNKKETTPTISELEEAQVNNEVELLKKEIPELKQKQEVEPLEEKKGDTDQSIGEEIKNESTAISQTQTQENIAEETTETPSLADTGENQNSIITLPNGAIVEMDSNSVIVRYIKEAPEKTSTNTTPQNTQNQTTPQGLFC